VHELLRIHGNGGTGGNGGDGVYDP
jgi:hypothetical protein